jgi:hypothetical protein
VSSFGATPPLDDFGEVGHHRADRVADTRQAAGRGVRLGPAVELSTILLEYDRTSACAKYSPRETAFPVVKFAG